MDRKYWLKGVWMCCISCSSLWGIGEETGRVLSLTIKYKHGIPIFIKTWVLERIQDKDDPRFPDGKEIVCYVQEMDNGSLQEILERLRDRDRLTAHGDVKYLSEEERAGIINTMQRTRYVDPHNNNAE
ncbi:MAG: hypothetical protein LBF21_01870 [Puniceicoccales bacterium]|jgi:hypothetical protein|nr:hypothetical protein [Puniceicoccales bacterium]